MEVKLAEAKAKENAIVDAGVKAAASAYALELTEKIAVAKRDADKEKIRWSTSFALPNSDYTVDANTKLDWASSAMEDSAITTWLPAYMMQSGGY